MRHSGARFVSFLVAIGIAAVVSGGCGEQTDEEKVVEQVQKAYEEAMEE